MKVTLQGTRGSLPTPVAPAVVEQRLVDTLNYYEKLSSSSKTGPESFVKQLPTYMKGGYGGNTSCIEVKSKDNTVLIDGGSGLRNCIGSSMNKEDKTIHLLMTHFHWDHLLGLPFFVPIYMKGYNINFYAVQDELEEVVRSLFRKPFFPVPFEALESNISFHKLEPRKAQNVAGFSVTPYLMDHPDECWGFKIEKEGKAFSYCVDNEALRTTAEELGEDLPIYQNVDLLVFDAQYSFKEAEEKKNWGHASAPKGLDIAIREKVKKIAFTHHDPMASDKDIAQISKLAVQYFEALDSSKVTHIPQWEVAIEGRTIVL